MARLDDPNTRGPALAEALTDAQRRKAERGEIEMVTMRPAGGGGFAMRAFSVMDIDPEAVWPVVRDADRFSEFMPRVEKSSIVERSEQGNVVRVEIGLPFPLKNLTSDARSVITDFDSGGHERRWKMIKGSYKRNDGAWTVLPHGEGRSLVIYELDVEPRLKVPEKLLKKAQTSALPEMFAAVRRRAGTHGGSP